MANRGDVVERIALDCNQVGFKTLLNGTDLILQAQRFGEAEDEEGVTHDVLS